MSNVLIYANNSSITKRFEDRNILFFQPSGEEEVDFQLTDLVTNQLVKLNPTKLFIRINLSDNYLEFIGLRLAYHIRLSENIALRSLPIILLTEESMDELLSLTEDKSILGSEGLYLSTEDPDRIDKFFVEDIAGCQKYQKFLKQLKIEAPAQYESNHSITNEWSILRWAETLGIPDEEPSLTNAKKNIESLLYYKFLKAVSPISSSGHIAEFKIDVKGRVLFIDDQWNKGWGFVLTKLFNNSNIEFKVFENGFDDKDSDTLCEECILEVEKFNPDVVILDLRLSAEDAENSNPIELSGHKVLEAIKKLNRGIQVIYFTASNKVWNLNTGNELVPDDYIVKDNPEFISLYEQTRENIERLTNSVGSGIIKARILKPIMESSADIKNICKLELNKKPQNYALPIDRLNAEKLAELLDVFDKLNEIFPNNLKYGFLTLVGIIEDIINDKYQKDSNGDHMIYVNMFSHEKCLFQQDNDRYLSIKPEYSDKFKDYIYSKEIYRLTQSELITYSPQNFARVPFNFKLTCLLHYYYNKELNEQEIFKYFIIYNIRSKQVAHSTKGNVTKANIILLLDLIKTLTVISSK